MKKIQLALKNFNNICQRTSKGKFGFLPDWLLYSSNRLDKEASGDRVKYQRYKRGSIVLVNFGVNLGYELSGNHFAIVLDKNDNPYNGVLTVIPLSSKCKPHYIDLGNCILDAASKKIIEESDKLSKKVDEFFEKENKTISESDVLLSETKQMNEVLERYRKLNKNTYALIENITTISKFKVMKPLNKFDPIGKIKVTDFVLNVIDLFIMFQYTDLIKCLDDEKLKEKFIKKKSEGDE